MKKILLFLLVISVPFLHSCKKNREFKKESAQAQEDNSNIQAEADGASKDANNAMSDNSLLAGKTLSAEAIAATAICGATIDSSQVAQGILTINYDGSTVCNNRSRSGSIKVTLQGYASGARWKDVGAVLQLDFINYKVTRSSDSKSLMFDGSKTLTNVSGGYFWRIFLGLPDVVTAVSGSNIKVTFDDGKESICNINREYTYNWSNNVLTCTGRGTGSFNNLNNLENYGTTREGDNFTSQVTQPIVWNSTCGAPVVVTGKLHLIVEAKSFEFTSTFGVDSSGDVVAPAANSCPYGYKVEWTYKNKTNSKIVKYS